MTPRSARSPRPARPAITALAALFALFLPGCGAPAAQTVSGVETAAGEPLAATPAAPAPALPARVRVGLERLAGGERLVAGADGIESAGPALEHLAGKRLALVVHAASVTADGRHAIDVVTGHGLEIVRLFAPEHGLRGRAAAGEKVESGIDADSGLRVVSLYGDARKPRPRDLSDLDALVFDLQGAGVRFFTYVSTLILALEAAAENDVELVVLDRPNPLGGQRIEGPVAAPRDVVAASFVNLAPGPLIHGLTMGEMALVVNARRARPARLSVVAMAGWDRDMTWIDSGRPWVSPSPNLRSAAAAIAYPGIALLEATNVSEGRGTQTPFLLFGAPWLAAADLEVAVAGFAFAPARFTPTASAAAPWPKYLDEACVGWRLRVVDARSAEPYRLGLAVVRQLSTRPGFEWRRDGAALTWLLGTPDVLAALEDGRTVDEIIAADRASHRAWRRETRDLLIYPRQPDRGSS